MRIIIIAEDRSDLIQVSTVTPAFRTAGIDARLACARHTHNGLTEGGYFAGLEVPRPAYHFDTCGDGRAVNARIVRKHMQELLGFDEPDAVVVIGGRSSALGAALSAAERGIPVAHLNAGARTQSELTVESVDRRLVDQLSSMHLTPFSAASDNLLAEGIEMGQIRLVGSLFAESAIRNSRRLDEVGPPIRGSLPARGYIYAVMQRQVKQSTLDALTWATSLPILVSLSTSMKCGTARAEFLGGGERVTLLPAVSYLESLALLRSAAAVVTDSSQTQDEACALSVPCVTLAAFSDRPVTIDVGANRVVGDGHTAVRDALHDALTASRGWGAPVRWDTEVSIRVADALQYGVVSAHDDSRLQSACDEIVVEALG